MGSIFLIFDLWMPEFVICVLKIKFSVKFPPKGLILGSQFKNAKRLAKKRLYSTL